MHAEIPAPRFEELQLSVRSRRLADAQLEYSNKIHSGAGCWNQPGYWLLRIMQTTGWGDESISDTRSGLFITCDQCVFAKCQMYARLPYMIEASGVMWWCTQWECGGDSSVSVWVNQTILAWGYLISTSLLQNVRFWSTHPFYATLKWCVFPLYQPKLNQQNNIELDHSKSERIRSFWWSRT